MCEECRSAGGRFLRVEQLDTYALSPERFTFSQMVRMVSQFSDVKLSLVALAIAEG